MTFLLDTNICSAHMRRPAGMAHRFFQFQGRLATTTIVLGGLYAGAYMLGGSVRLLASIADLVQDLQVFPFDARCAKEFGKLRGHLHNHGIAVSPLDLQIAAVAIANDLILVTNNTKDFRHVPDLRLDDWLTT